MTALPTVTAGQVGKVPACHPENPGSNPYLIQRTLITRSGRCRVMVDILGLGSEVKS